MGEQSASANQRRATLMLVIVTALWGLSFPWMKSWQNAAKNGPGGELLAAFTLIGIRMSIALMLIVVCMPGQTFRATRREHAYG
ncbi:MAG: hypothetical protein ACRD36_06190, partial [Candidatus Acidiferrum sp.]